MVGHDRYNHAASLATDRVIKKWSASVSTYNVFGPIPVPVYRKHGRRIYTERLDEFWQELPDIGTARGCYVFGIRAGRGITPCYVGKATRTFRQEVFAPHKLDKYHRALIEYKRGTPVLFFVSAPRRRGRANHSATGEIESFLIQQAVAANPNLSNVKGTRSAEWGIAGVIRGGQGKPSTAACAFKKALKIP